MLHHLILTGWHGPNATASTVRGSDHGLHRAASRNSTSTMLSCPPRRGWLTRAPPGGASTRAGDPSRGPRQGPRPWLGPTARVSGRLRLASRVFPTSVGKPRLIRRAALSPPNNASKGQESDQLHVDMFVVARILQLGSSFRLRPATSCTTARRQFWDRKLSRIFSRFVQWPSREMPWDRSPPGAQPWPEGPARLRR